MGHFFYISWFKQNLKYIYTFLIFQSCEVRQNHDIRYIALTLMRRRELLGPETNPNVILLIHRRLLNTPQRMCTYLGSSINHIHFNGFFESETSSIRQILRACKIDVSITIRFKEKCVGIFLVCFRPKNIKKNLCPLQKSSFSQIA